MATQSAPQPSTELQHLSSLHADATVTIEQQTQLKRVQAALGHITSIVVSDWAKEDGHHFYTIDIDLANDVQRLPTQLSAIAGPAIHVQTKHRFYKFCNLQREMFYHARSGHLDQKRPCRFCAKVIEELSHSRSVPHMYHAIFSSTSSLKAQLTSFLNSALELALNEWQHSGKLCEGREMVPVKVKQFLLGDGGEEDASQSVKRREEDMWGPGGIVFVA